MAGSLRWHGRPVDLLLVHSVTSLETWLVRDFARGRPILARLCTEGVVPADASEGRLPALRVRLRERLEAGPGPPSPAALDRAGYVLPDLLDDLTGASDPGEQVFAEACVVQETARPALRPAGRRRVAAARAARVRPGPGRGAATGPREARRARGRGRTAGSLRRPHGPLADETRVVPMRPAQPPAPLTR